MTLPSRRRPAMLAAFWVALIFGTSCYFINARTFVAWAQGLIGKGPAGQAFETFWYAGGGLIVVKGWHFTEYAVLLMISAAVLRRWLPPQRAVWWGFTFCALFAASDEWHQTFVPGRDGCVRDVIIDCAGALVAALWLNASARSWAGSG